MNSIVLMKTIGHIVMIGLRHLAGVDRDRLCHETLEVAAQTDTFNTDQSLLRQHRPEHTVTHTHTQNVQSISGSTSV